VSLSAPIAVPLTPFNPFNTFHLSIYNQYLGTGMTQGAFQRATLPYSSLVPRVQECTAPFPTSPGGKLEGSELCKTIGDRCRCCSQVFQSLITHHLYRYYRLPRRHARAAALGPGHMARLPKYRRTPDLKRIRAPPEPHRWSTGTVGSNLRGYHRCASPRDRQFGIVVEAPRVFAWNRPYAATRVQN